MMTKLGSLIIFLSIQSWAGMTGEMFFGHAGAKSLVLKYEKVDQVPEFDLEKGFDANAHLNRDINYRSALHDPAVDPRLYFLSELRDFAIKFMRPHRPFEVPRNHNLDDIMQAKPNTALFQFNYLRSYLEIILRDDSISEDVKQIYVKTFRELMARLNKKREKTVIYGKNPLVYNEDALPEIDTAMKNLLKTFNNGQQYLSGWTNDMVNRVFSIPTHWQEGMTEISVYYLLVASREHKTDPNIWRNRRPIEEYLEPKYLMTEKTSIANRNWWLENQHSKNMCYIFYSPK